MKTYLALLRGVNVGGNGTVKMSELKEHLTAAGLRDVQTYINSGNVIFASNQTGTRRLAEIIEKVIVDKFGVASAVVVISKERWQRIIEAAPKGWGKDEKFKHNLLVLLEPYNTEEALAAVGTLKPGIEAVAAGDGVLYQSLSWTDFGKTTSGRIASNPIYKRMTIRTFNTAQKLLALLEETEH